MSDIERRKTEHIDVILNSAASQSRVSAGFDKWRFEHNALPETNLNEIDLSTVFLSRTMRAPLIVSSMTGGPKTSVSLNQNIAEACHDLGIGFGVGSQRIALDGGSTHGFSPALRKAAPNVPILANFGAAQLHEWDGPEMARRAVDMIEADALIIHLNPLQEAAQIGGDTNWSGLLDKIATLCRTCTFPIIVKEVGAGISAPVARRLVEVGVACIDVAGLGGTSWAAVEAERAGDPKQRAIAEAFRDWGLPTSEAIRQVRLACPDTTIVGSGGIRDGIDCAKAIRLGADVAALAAGVLPGAIAGHRQIRDTLSTVIEQLRIACFCTGSANLKMLRSAPFTEINQPPYEWARHQPVKRAPDN